MKIQKKRSMPGQERPLLSQKKNTLKWKFNWKGPKIMKIVSTMDFGPVDFMARISRHNCDIMIVATEEPITLPPTTSIFNAARIMSKGRISKIPVADTETNHLEGMITSTDTINFLTSNPYAAANTDIRSVMHDEAMYLERKVRVTDTIKIMKEKNIGGIPVVDELRHVCGICTEKDFMGLVAGIPANRSISQYINKAVEKVPSYSTIESAVVTIVRRGFQKIPVMSKDRLLGIITASDILGYLTTEHAFGNIIKGNFQKNLKKPISSLIKKNAEPISSDADLGKAAQIMIDNEVGSLTVMKDGIFHGIVTSRDILNAISE
ncbi:CBS domain-containing protein [Methanolobus sp. ZRKC2]|uniref:CBS domain-containing protein n=1 Tax=Methanolobus sp. ZRKC2 TaxID=3125783 RepID=UPI00325131C9